MTLKELEGIIPFDQFSRQYQVSVIIDQLRPSEERLKILDAGGYKGHTADFLDKDDVTVLDLYDVQDDNYVKGSALEMPFKDDSFDYVLSFDVLEHIPADSRKKFFSECARVAKRGVIICAPNKTAANQQAEHSLNDLHVQLHNQPHEWLKEHIEYAIPDFEQLEALAKSKKYHTTRFHSNKVQLWVAMQQAIFMNSKYSLAAEQLIEINQFYNHNLKYDGGGQPDSAYRSILCCLNDDDDNQKLKNLGSLNAPIDPKLEIELLDRIGKYNRTLVAKTDNLAIDYKGLYEHEKTRAEQLQANGEKLGEQLEEQVNQLQDSLRNRARIPSLHYVKKKVRNAKGGR